VLNVKDKGLIVNIWPKNSSEL